MPYLELFDLLLSYKVAVENPEDNTQPVVKDNTKIHLKTGHVGVSWVKLVTVDVVVFPQEYGTIVQFTVCKLLHKDCFMEEVGLSQHLPPT
jgi:hypothetical protein